jgi:hypothetical protein
MANKKISELDSTTSLQDADLVLISQSGVGFTSKKIAISDFRDSVGSPIVTELSNAASNVSTDCTTGNIFKLHCASDHNLNNPTGATDGQATTWWIYQDNADREITLSAKFTLPSSASALSWSNGAATSGAMDMLATRYDATEDKFYIVAFVNGY